MKRLILAIALLMGAAATISAQGGRPSGLVSPFLPAEKSVSFDVHAGAGVSQMRYVAGETDGLMGNVPTYTGGVGVRFHLLSGLALESGIDVITRGGYDKKIFNNKYSSTYIELPLMLSFSPLVSRAFRLSIEAGGYGAYGIAGKTLNEVGTFPYFGTNEYAVAKPLDYGVGGGLSLEFARRVRLSFRYEYGLCNIVGDNIRKITDLHNESMFIRLGFVF